MTRYGFEPETTSIRASWSTGRGLLAATVVTDSGLDTEHGAVVARGLEWLSARVWHCYSHPAGPVDDDYGGVHWQRSQERAALDDLAAAVRAPRLPDQWGETYPAATWVAELAHDLGRSLQDADAAAAVVDAVAAEVTREVAAITAAERGELAGRAEQATELGPPDPSPVQVAAADALLRADPLAGPAAFAALDPAAAAVAALAWLAAAAAVTARVAETEIEHVIATADDVEAMPVATLEEVLHRLHAHRQAPHAIVVELIQAAQIAATGQIPDPEALMAEFSDALERFEQYAGRGLVHDPAMLLPQRVCTLDPTRPALDLLEDLLYGIEGCWQLYCEYVDSDQSPEWDPLEDDEPAPEEMAAETARVRAMFCAAVAAEAAHHPDRLT